MSERIGPTRLILLNCGKFDYAEIDLDVPLHLVGPNNVGKTSLIALLQFLYIDEQTKMRFSRDMATTRKYYFPDVSSFALFESLGPEGFMLTGVHGLGPVRKYEIERFACQGQFSRADFLSADNGILLAWDQVKANMVSKGFTSLKPSGLRAALIGSTLKKGGSPAEAVNLSLVPLRKRVEYRRFCTVFLNLLRLSHLRQEELKKLLLELSDGDFTKRQINLYEDYAPQLAQLQREKANVKDLQCNETAIRRILDNVVQRDLWRASLKALDDRMGQLYCALQTKTKDRLATLTDQQVQISIKTDELATRHNQCSAEHDEKRQKKWGLDHLQRELSTLADQFSDYHPQWSDSQILELEKKVRALESQLESVAHESTEAIERRLKTTQLQHQQLTEQLENIEHAVASVLVQQIGADQTCQLSRLFNEGILRLSTQGQGAKVRIHDVKALTRRLSVALERFQASTYQDDAVTLELDSLGQFDLKDYLDPDRLRENLIHLNKVVQQAQGSLHVARDHETHIQALADNKTRLAELQDQRTRFRDYQAKKEQHKDIDKQVLVLERELVQIHTQVTDLTTQQQNLHQKTIQLDNERNTLTWQLDKVSRKIEDLPRAEAHWQPEDLPTRKMALEDVIEQYRQLSDKHQRLANHIDGELETIHSQTYSRYQGETEQDTLTLFRNELESLKGKQAALEESWTSLTVALKKDFKELHRDMETLSAKVHSLNGKLAKVHISNLVNLKIVLSFHAEFRSHITQIERSEAQPLFEDTTKTDEAMRKISQMLQERPVILLEDMFDMHFEITTIQGGTKKYDHLDRIESNGTTITIKVLINLILLRGLLINENVNVPFYLDECSSLDSENLRSIVQEARKLGFIAVLASPEAMDAADHLYYLSERNGRVTLNPKHSLVEIVRTEPENA